MNVLKRISTAVKAFRSHEEYDEAKWRDFTSGPLTKSGVRVNETSSLTISALFAGLNFLAGTMASLPKVIYRRLPEGGKTKAYDHPLYDRLHNKPNSSNLTSWQWTFTQVFHKYLWGNWYTYIDTESYRNRELIPLLPDRTYLDPENEERYITHTKQGQKILIPRREMLHIPHISLDGVQGKGIVHYARESLGLTKAEDEFASAFYGQGIHPGRILMLKPGTKQELRKELQDDFNKKYAGMGKSWMTIILPYQAELNQEEIDPEKAQALESRQFSVIEVSRWLNLPPHVVRDLTHATYSNIEQQALELVIYSLLPITTQIEQAMNVVFFDENERQEYFVKFELKGLMRGDVAARTAFYTAMLDRGVLSADDVLDLEDMNPQPKGLGKIYLVPLNMLNKEMVVSPQPLTIEDKTRKILPDGARVVRYQLKELRSGALRRRLTIAYKPKFEEYGKSIVESEVEAIRAAIAEMLSQKGIVGLEAWLESFYQDFAREIGGLAGPLLDSYASAVLPAAQEEIASEAEIGPQYAEFEREYIDYFQDRHIRSSRGQIQAVIHKAQEEQANEAEALEQRLAEWEEKRPAKIAMREPVRAESAFARSVFALSGISKIRSVAFGKSCPYCQALSGKIIGITELFLPAGEFQPEGAETPLIVTKGRSHPPYHDGCDCGIAAEI